jgi:hypothetical protein
MRTGVVLAAAMMASTAYASSAVEGLRDAVPACEAARAYCFQLRLHVAVGDAGAIASAGWVRAQVATANRHFTPVDVGFEVASVNELPASTLRIATRKDRDALGARIRGAVIDVFVVDQLDDVDDPGELIRGVAWRRGDRKFVILSALALERTLAHELGHVFGLPHSTYAISIMNKTSREEPAPDQRRFADPELAKMKPVIRKLVRDNVLANAKRRT